MAELKTILANAPLAPVPLGGTEDATLLISGEINRSPSLTIKDAIRDASDVANSVVEIFSMDDLPAPISSERLLEAGKLYLWKNPTSTPDELVVPSGATIVFSSVNRLTNAHTYTGTGIGIKMASGATATRVDFENFSTTSTNAAGMPFDLKVSSFCALLNSRGFSSGHMGLINGSTTATVSLLNFASVGAVSGLVVEDAPVINLNAVGIIPVGPMTTPSFSITGSSTSIVTMGATKIDSVATNGALYISPTVSPTCRVTLTTMSTAGAGVFYEVRSNGAFTAVSDLGGGNSQFTATTTGLTNGDSVLLGSINYNAGVVVSNVTPTTFDAAIAFVATDTGTWNNGSLDQTNKRVNAQLNGAGFVDSRPLAAFSWNANATSTPVSSANYQAVVLSNVILNAITENYTLTNSVNGVWRWDGLETISSQVEIPFTVASGAGTNEYRFTIIKNGVFPAIGAVTTDYTPVVVKGEDKNSVHLQFISLAPGDTFQLAQVGVGTTTAVTLSDGSNLAE